MPREIAPLATKMEVTDKATGAQEHAGRGARSRRRPRPDTTAEGLAKLKPVFEGGTTTAGQCLAAVGRIGGDGDDGCGPCGASAACPSSASSAACSWRPWAPEEMSIRHHPGDPQTR